MVKGVKKEGRSCCGSKKKVVEKESKKDVDRKPKYVHNLLKAADERQKEFERRIERQVRMTGG